MRISISIDEPGDGMAAAYATQIKDQHALQAFESAYALSTWMHATFSNPRILISTNEREDEITVKSNYLRNGKHVRFLTISLY